MSKILTVGHLKRVIEDLPNDAEIAIYLEDKGRHMFHLELESIEGLPEGVAVHPLEGSVLITGTITNYTNK